MSDEPKTRPSLLIRLRNPDDGDAWSLFVTVYQPLILGFVRGRGLQEADAADLTQDVLEAVSRNIRRLDYDPGRGAFRSWLFTIVRNRLHNFLTRRPIRGAGGSDAVELLREQPARDDELEAIWDREHERRTFSWAAERVRRDVKDATWEAFWSTAVEGQGAQQVADRLGLTVAAVYLAKSRVMARLKDQVRQLEELDTTP